MEKIEIKSQVGKDSSEVGKAVYTVIQNYFIARKDGWQSSQDIPAILMGSLKDLMIALEGANNIGPGYKEDPGATLKGIVLPIIDVFDIFQKKSIG